jgi:hypothetical protein
MRSARILESLLPFVDGKFVNLLVPYPMGFYAKGMDGRIDDPAAGWKGRGLWSTDGTARPLPRGRRQRDHEQGGEVPAAPRSPGAVTTLRRDG